MVELHTEMPGMAEADAKLAALEASESGQDGNTTAPEARAPAPEAPSANNSGERAPAASDTTAQTSEPKQADTPAAAEAEGKAETAKAESRNAPAKPEGEAAKAHERKPTKFERDAERLPKTWKEFNARRAEQEADYKTRQEALARSQAEFERRQAEFAAGSQTPGAADYEAAAARYSAQAKALEAEAAQAETTGDFDKAEAKRKAAAKTEFWAEQYRDAAAAERNNPPDARKQQA